MTSEVVKNQEELKRAIKKGYEEDPKTAVLIPRSITVEANESFEIAVQPTCWRDWDAVNGVKLDGKWFFFEICVDPGSIKLIKMEQ